MKGGPPAHRAELALLGLRTTVEADDVGLLRAALAGYSAWSGQRPADGDATPSVRLRLHRADSAEPPESADSAGSAESPGSTESVESTRSVESAAAARAEPAAAPALSVCVEGRRLSIAGPGVDGWADADLGEARCAVPPELAANPARLAAEVLDTLLLFLLTRAGRVPVHASGIVVGGTAVVLAGPSGAGKSTLALAAFRAGLPVLSDDTVYVQLAPRFRVWGFPRPIHVFPADAPDAPDAAADAAMRLRGGRWKTAVPVEPAGAAPVAERAVLCLLERGDAVGLRPVSSDDAVAAMDALLEPGFDHFREALPDAVRALAEGGAWRLTLSADAAEAIDALRRMLAGKGPVE